MFKDSITWSHAKSIIAMLMLMVFLIVPWFSALLSEQQVVQDDVAYHYFAVSLPVLLLLHMLLSFDNYTVMCDVWYEYYVYPRIVE